MRLAVPRDYVLARDLCSYGYFLLEPNHWDVGGKSFSRVLEVSGGPAKVSIGQEDGGKRGGALGVRVDRGLSRPERAEVAAQIARMLRLDEDEGTVREFHGVDPRWKKAGRENGGIGGRARLMRSPTFFEDVIKTVTSCNVAWPSTIIMNRRLCEVAGRGGGFPTAARLARTRPEVLRARCSVGYRDKRIVELAKMFAASPARGGVDAGWFEDPATDEGEIHARLLEWPGVGPYAAANILQLLGRYTRLPLDTESVRHGKTVLGMKGSDRAIMKQVGEHFRPFGRHAFRSYWFELWTYYEAKRGAAWTWERETTGKTFTASQLREQGAEMCDRAG